MNNSEFINIVDNIKKSSRKVKEQEVRNVLNEKEHILLIGSVGIQKFSKVISFFQTLDKQNNIYVWAQKEYEEITKILKHSVVEFIDHEGKFSSESKEFKIIEQYSYEVIIFCINTKDNYRNLNLEYLSSKLNQKHKAIIYSFDYLEQFICYDDIDYHIHLIEDYRDAICRLYKD